MEPECRGGWKMVASYREKTGKTASHVGFTNIEVIPCDIVHPRIPRKLIQALQSFSYIAEMSRNGAGQVGKRSQPPADGHSRPACAPTAVSACGINELGSGRHPLQFHSTRQNDDSEPSSWEEDPAGYQDISKQHNKKGDVVRLLCVILGVLSEVFSIVYDLLKGGNNANSSDAYGAPATPDEQSGDQERAIFILGYQAITDPMMV